MMQLQILEALFTTIHETQRYWGTSIKKDGTCGSKGQEQSKRIVILIDCGEGIVCIDVS